MIKRLVLSLSMILLLMIIPLNVYGEEKKVKKVQVGGEQHLQFKVSATASTADYRYRTKGWNIKAVFGSKSFSDFYKDGQLEGTSSDTLVSLPLEDILVTIGVTDEYLSQGGVLKLDAGQIILYHGAETEPRYNSYDGIISGILDRYGIPWGPSTVEDLKSYYSLSIDFDPVKSSSPIPKISDTSGRVYPPNVRVYGKVGETLTFYGDKSWFPEAAQKKIYVWQWKKASSSSWNNGPQGEGRTVFTLTVDEETKYDVRLGVTDELEEVK